METNYTTFLLKYGITHTRDQIEILESDLRNEKDSYIKSILEGKISIAKKVLELQKKKKSKIRVFSIFSFTIIF